jgi:nucleoside-diphosphate-sugar epimerase
MKQISILGCGWLGLPLAEKLRRSGYSINGSTTNPDKITGLNAIGMRSFLIELKERYVKGEIEMFLEKSELLIIDVPPKLRGENPDTSTALSMTFVQKIQNLIPYIEKSTIYKVIFISSTSVYADDNSVVTEETQPQPDTESGKQLLEVEKLLQNNPYFKTIVLRFGGLIGNDRNPVTSLSGKKNIKNPDAPINLIHQEDCIGIIETIVEKLLRDGEPNTSFENETFNAVMPFHPSRKAYYTGKAMEMALDIPEFDEESPSKGKTISSKKLEMVLGYTFKNNAL